MTILLIKTNNIALKEHQDGYCQIRLITISGPVASLF